MFSVIYYIITIWVQLIISHFNPIQFTLSWKRRLKIPGVYFACDKCASQIKENWTGRVENIKRIINAWEKKKPEHWWQSLHYKNIFNFTVCIYHVSIGSPRSCSHSGKQNIILIFCAVRKTVIAKPLRKWRELLFVVFWKMVDSTWSIWNRCKQRFCCSGLDGCSKRRRSISGVMVLKNVFAPFGDKYLFLFESEKSCF